MQKQHDLIEHKTIKNRLDFVNGINIAWVAFGRDVGKDPEYGTEYHPDLNTFGLIMDKVANAGGNVLRWWYHTNGSTNPTYDENQKVTTDPAFFHEDVLKILDLAASKGLQIQICLWSFDMLKDQWNVDAIANKKLLTEEVYIQAYIDNSLIPLVNAVGEHPGLYAWEIFNEAEGMTIEYGDHWPGFLEKISMVDVQRFVNKTASAIRTAQPNIMITNGALGFLTNVDDSEKGYQNYYTDQKLEDIGGNPNGYLDFYSIHYYRWAGEDGSPFHNLFNAQKVDKAAIIAEYYPDDTFGVAPENLAVTLQNNGWKGSLLWSWTDRSWDTMKPVIQNVSNVLSISDTTMDGYSSITIFPNPARETLFIKGVKEKTAVYITDVSGKTILKSTLREGVQNTIDIAEIQQGIYYVTLGNKVTKKIIKM